MSHNLSCDLFVRCHLGFVVSKCEQHEAGHSVGQFMDGGLMLTITLRFLEHCWTCVFKGLQSIKLNSPVNVLAH